MVESRAVKTRKDASMIPIRERILFHAMKAALQVGDNSGSQVSLKFTWDNNRGGAARSLARLHMMYLFQQHHGTSSRSLLYTVL